MNRTCLVTAALALLCMAGIAQATTIDTVTVGDPGNVADTLTGYGSVGYTYNIGKYEVTAGQYTEFLNAVAKTDTYGLYYADIMPRTDYGIGITRNGTVGTYTYSVANDFAARPVSCVTYWDACRFANWLGNGQKTGAQDATTTERGAYTLDGYNGEDGRWIGRNAGYTLVLASEDEWYKAAYYKSGGTNAGYWLYPTSSDVAPGQDMADASGNNANYYPGSGAWPGLMVYPGLDSGKYTTVAGEFQNSSSPFGTFDQGGNVWEWNEAIIPRESNEASRGLRGGSFDCNDYHLQASYRHSITSLYDDIYAGFRVVQLAPVPEPSSITALAGGLVGLLGIRKRRV